MGRILVCGENIRSISQRHRADTANVSHHVEGCGGPRPPRHVAGARVIFPSLILPAPLSAALMLVMLAPRLDARTHLEASGRVPKQRQRAAGFSSSLGSSSYRAESRRLSLRGGGGEEGEGGEEGGSEDFEMSVGGGDEEVGAGAQENDVWLGCETVQCEFERIGDTNGALYWLGQRHAEDTGNVSYSPVTGKRLFVNPAKSVCLISAVPSSQFCACHRSRISPVDLRAC